MSTILHTNKESRYVRKPMSENERNKKGHLVRALKKTIKQWMNQWRHEKFIFDPFPFIGLKWKNWKLQHENYISTAIKKGNEIIEFCQWSMHSLYTLYPNYSFTCGIQFLLHSGWLGWCFVFHHLLSENNSRLIG